MVGPELVGLGLLLLGIGLLLVEQYLFGYSDSETVQRLVIALTNYGLLLIAVAYGLRVA